MESLAGWWLTNPSEKSWSSSVGIMTFPIFMESHNPAMFQSPPSSEWNHLVILNDSEIRKSDSQSDSIQLLQLWPFISYKY